MRLLVIILAIYLFSIQTSAELRVIHKKIKQQQRIKKAIDSASVNDKKMFYLFAQAEKSEAINNGRSLANTKDTWKDHYNGFITTTAVAAGLLHAALKKKFPKDDSAKERKSIDITAGIMQALMIPTKDKVETDDSSKKYYEEQKRQYFTENFGKGLTCNTNFLSFTTNSNQFALVTKENISSKDHGKLLRMNVTYRHSRYGLKKLSPAEELKLADQLKQEEARQAKLSTVSFYNKKMEPLDLTEKIKNQLRLLASMCNSSTHQNVLLKHYKKSSLSFIDTYSEMIIKEN